MATTCFCPKKGTPLSHKKRSIPFRKGEVGGQGEQHGPGNSSLPTPDAGCARKAVADSAEQDGQEQDPQQTAGIEERPEEQHL